MKKYKLVSSLDIGDVVLQTLVWVFISIITLGVGAIFFGYYFIRLIINTTEIHLIEE